MATHAQSVEDIKRGSRGLRGSLLASLADPVTGALAEDDQTLIKYHGSYQQDDRDLREERRQQKLEPDYSFMIRTRTPGGVVTPTQWLQLDRIATTFAERGLRLTTRQAFQFHGVIKGELKPTMQAINAALVDTLAACGDVNRNIAVSANARSARVQAAVQAQAAALSRHLLPNSRAYYEIWLDEVQVAGSGEEAEPVYGAAYLPRKFKIAFAVPPDNDVDVFAQDLGFIAIVEHGELQGFNVTVGGGMGASHGDAETYPRLGDLLGFIPPEQVIAVAESVVTTQRDWGNRAMRKRARLKYTIDDRGLPAFKAEVERRRGVAFAQARAFDFEHNADPFGWQRDDEDHWQLHLRIPAGRIQGRALDGLRAVAAKLEGSAAQFRLSANQNLLLAGLDAMQRVAIAPVLREHGLETWEQATPTALRALACVALPTCGLAMAEAERYLPTFVERFEELLAKHNLREHPIHLRLSGCPNGCSRPYLAEVALVGKGPGRYNLMLGADQRGQRLNRLYRENLDEQAILAALDTLLADYALTREPAEAFGDFLIRTGALS
jgi:sulfite reductase (NADPH) hemoprotein beta-component